MKSAVKKWGTNAAIRLPAAIMNAIHPDIGDMVDVRADAGRIVIRPARERACDIKRLIKAITDENMHEVADFGPAADNEVGNGVVICADVLSR
jgi:antitoxin MazE